MHAVIGQDIRATVGFDRKLRRHTHHREVGGAATHVGNQRDFLGPNTLLVMQRGGDWLELECDGLESRILGSRCKLRLRLGVGGGIVIDKEGRPPDHHLDRRMPQFNGRRVTQETQELRDDFGERIAPQLDLCLFFVECRPEQTLDRAQQASVIAIQVTLHGLAAKGRPVVVKTEEQRRRNRRGALLQRQQARALGIAERDR